MDISSLSDKIIARILLFLDAKTRLRCSLVCKHWNSILTKAPMLEDVILKLDEKKCEQIANKEVVFPIPTMERSYTNISLKLSNYIVLTSNVNEFLRYITFRYPPNQDFKCWHKLCSNVRELHLSMPMSFTSTHLLICFANLRSLNIDLTSSGIPSRDFKYFTILDEKPLDPPFFIRRPWLRHIPKLTSLTIRTSTKSRYLFSILSDFLFPSRPNVITSLRLEISACEYEEDFWFLVEFKKLKFLALTHNSLKIHLLRKLLDYLPELEKIEFRAERLFGDGLFKIKNPEKIVHLVINGYFENAPEFFVGLRNFCNLRYLEFDHFFHNAVDLSDLKFLTNLRHLLLPIGRTLRDPLEIPEETLATLHTLRVGNKLKLSRKSTIECPELRELQFSYINGMAPSKFIVPKLRVLLIQ